MIPKGWQLIELKEFVEKSSKKYDPSKGHDNLPCIELEHLSQATGQLLGTTNSNSQLSIKNCFKTGDVLFGKLRPYLKKYLHPNFDGVCSSEIWVLAGKKDICDSRYLYQIVQSHRFIEICNKTTGSKMPRADWELISDEYFLLPPMNEQIVIAEILSNYDKTTERLASLIKIKERQKKGLMQNLLSAEIRFKEFREEDYIEGNLSEFVDLRHGYQFRKEDFVKEGVPVIKIGNVTGYELDLNDLTFIEGNRLEEFKDVIISDGDLLMSLTGNIGRVVEVSNMTKPMLQNYRVGKFIPLDESQLSKRYLKHLLSSPIVTRQFLNMSNQSAQANFGKQDMDKIFITFPKNINEQRKISDTITESENEIRNLNLQLEKIKFQKKGLMQQLLTGKIRV